MHRSDPLFRLVNRIYEGAVEPAAWPGIVEDIRVFFRSPKGLLLTNFIGPEEGGLNVSSGISQRSLDLWNARYIPHDMWTQGAMRKGFFYDGAVALGTDVVPHEDFLQSKIYRELLVHEGVARLCACIVFASNSGGVLPTSLGVYRGLADPAYEPADRDLMRVLTPHLSRALGVMYRLRDAELKRVASLDALDRIAAGVLLLDRGGAVHHLNAEAQRIVERGDGLALTEAGPRLLSASDPAARRTLADAIRSAVTDDLLQAPHFSSTVSIPRAGERRPYVLQFAPLPHTNAFSTRASPVAAIVFVTDPDRATTLDAATLKAMFGITPAETRLAARLCAGETLAAAAAHCAVEKATARSQLAALYDKTQTHSQAQLVRLLLSLSAKQ